MAVRGISLLDLAALPAGAQALIPDALAGHLENLAVVDHSSTSSAQAHIHSGTVQPISDMGFPALRNWPVEVPGLNTGLPFRLVRMRVAPGAGQNLEPAAQGLFLDLIVERIAITVPGLRPATLIPSAPGVVAHLAPDPSRSSVRIVGSGTVRIDLTGGAETVRFIDAGDPFDPSAPSGAIYALTFEPTTFYFGDSELGMTVDRLLWDDSETVTPPDILARGQTPGWQGISIAEATLFLPPNAPLVQDLNVGVRDVLLGSPAGLQGEIRLELGRTPVSPDLVEFLQDLSGPQTLTTNGSGRDLTVGLLTSPTQAARVRAGLPAPVSGSSTHPEMSWTLPDGVQVAGADTGWFSVEPGQTLSAHPSEEVDGERIFEQTNTYTFTAATPKVAPQLNLTVNGVALSNVVHVAGTTTALQGLTFTSTATTTAAAAHTWEVGAGTGGQAGRGQQFRLDAAALPIGTTYLTYTDEGQRRRRVRIDVLQEGQLLIGAGDGIHDATGTLLIPRGVAATYDLAAFHRDAALRPFAPAATTTTVPGGALAELTVDLGSGVEPDDPADPITEEAIRYIQVLFEFNTANPTYPGVYHPVTSEGTVEATVAAWAKVFTGAKFVVVGRTCDIGSATSNTQLATQRAQAAASWLPTGTTFIRGEQTAPSSAMATEQNATTPPMRAAEKTATWLIKADFTNEQRTAWGSSTVNENRVHYRRVDIYAVGGTYTPPSDPADSQLAPTDTQRTDAGLRRSYRPGTDVVTITPPGRRDPALPFLVRIVVRWDSPTVTSLADAIPTQAEFTFEWASTNVTVPGSSTPVAVRSPSDTSTAPSTEIFTLTGRWSYDARSGQTVFSLSIESHGDPAGLAALDSEVLAVALALAPALLAGIGAAGVDGAAVRMGALAIASGIFATIVKDGRVVIHRAEVEHRQRSLSDATGFRTRLLLDYTCEVGFAVDAAGLGNIGTDDDFPMKVTYKKVGLEFDDAKTQWYEKFGVVYDDVSFEIADPGRWRIDGDMGNILRVAATRAGAGSTWFELDLEFVLDLGVVAITGATVRVIIDGSSFSAELRGIGLSVDIEGVLSGSGRLVLGDGGAFKAALELSLPTIGVKGMGDLSYDPATDFLSIGLGLILPVGIPLANSGLGLFGFLGRFVSNGQRALPTGFDDDPVGREIAWYRDTPGKDKFKRLRGQWALGLGVIIGTLPDQAFTFNATGMIVVCFPDPTVILGIDAKLVQKPEPGPKEQGSAGAGAGLEILGLVVVDDSAVMLGVRGGYEIPKVLKLTVPLDGYFPYPSTPKDAFVRIGADGVEGRGGDPVALTLLPETLDAKAYAYLMVEEKQLHNLGGDDRFDFDGFSIGFGAGFDIRWSAGPIKLEAGAKILVGLGTNPFLLKGGIMVHGELDLVVVSVGAHGEIIATMWGPVDDLKINLSGKFCGHVDLFFFEVEGCVRFDIGDSLTPGPPPPPAPIGKVSLTDRRGFTTAVATADTPGPEQTVWPDTVPVIEFTHQVSFALPSSSAFTVPTVTPAGPAWSGTSEMKYAYRITGVELRAGSTPVPGPLVSNWWHPTNRPGVLATGDVAVSEEEGLFLALLSWNPAPWSYWLTDGGEGIPGDPAITPGRVCEPAPKPPRACALGKDARRTGTDALRLATPTAAAAPFPSTFAYTPSERILGTTPAQALPLLGALGRSYEQGAVGAGPFGDDVWWLSRVTHLGFTERTGELAGPIGTAIRDPELELVVCRDTRPRPQEVTPSTTCYDSGKDHPRAGEVLGPTTTVGPAKLAANGDLRTLDTGSGIGIRFPDSGLRIDLPQPADEVTVTLVLGGRAVRVTALDARGRILDEQDSDTQQRVMLQTSVKGTRIAAVQLAGGSSEAGLVRICWTVGIREVEAEPLPAADSSWPVVVGVGTTSTGKRVELQWKATQVKSTQSRDGECSIVRYLPTRSGITWSYLTIKEWSGTGKRDAGQVGVLRLCGVNAAAAAQASQNAAAVKDLKKIINTAATSADPTTVRNLLQANTSYEIRIRWEWQGWIKTETQPTPPAAPSGTWNPGGEHVVRFRTAATLTATGTPPAELVDERTFDPRALIRYLIGFDPDTGSAPHFLDDTLLVHLAVDHADRLANLYGHDLHLRLRRTDPPPGSLASGGHPPDEDLSVSWGGLYDSERALNERRYLEAIREAPCLEEPPLGGTTGTVTADLEPKAWYDLMLMATPTADPDAEQVVISRSHFQTSRYRSAADLLAALGFSSVTSPFVAADAIVSAPLSSTVLTAGDKAFDAALTQLGLDPWPLSPEARTSVLWWRDGSTWKMAGVLLEAPEAIVRTGRTSLDIGTATYGSAALTVARCNEAGTRVLLTPASPVAVSAAGALRLDLVSHTTAADGTVTSTTVSGRRQALRVPRAVYMEAGA